MDTNLNDYLREDQMIPAIRWMAEQIPDGFFAYLADDSQNRIYANKVCLRLFDCETKEEFSTLTGDSFRGLVHPEVVSQILCKLQTSA